jgi:hypothetical protein
MRWRCTTLGRTRRSGRWLRIWGRTRRRCGTGSGSRTGDAAARRSSGPNRPRRPAGVDAEIRVGFAAGGSGERRIASPGPEVGGGTRHSAEGGPVFRWGDALVNRFQFVADHSERYGVKRLCRILGIARSSFYHWKATVAARAARHAADAALAARIRAVHTAFDGTYGVPDTGIGRAAGHGVPCGPACSSASSGARRRRTGAQEPYTGHGAIAADEWASAAELPTKTAHPT